MVILVLTVLFILAVVMCVSFGKKANRVFEIKAEAGFATVSAIKLEYIKHIRNKNTGFCLIYFDEMEDDIRRNNFSGEENTAKKHLKQLVLTVFTGDDKCMAAPYKNGGYLIISENDKFDILEKFDCINSGMHTFLRESDILGEMKLFLGIYNQPSNDVEFDEAVNRAKTAYRYAVGKDFEYAVWNRELHKEVTENDDLKKTIQQEVEDNHFYLEWQPIVDITTGKIVAAEILSRLNSEDKGIVSPGKFVPVLSELGICEKFDYYIFEKACKWLSSRIKAGKKYIGVSVNFFRDTIGCPDFTKKIIGLIEKYEIPEGIMRIEILEESLNMSQHDEVLVKNLEELHKAGVLIMLDDFGAGNTSFIDVNSYVVDIVKIDRSIMENSNTQAGNIVFKNIVKMAKELGAWIICEGVTNDEQLEHIKNAECKFVQGFYFYKPMPITEFEQVLEKNEG